MGFSRFVDYTDNIENGLRALEDYMGLYQGRFGTWRFADLLREAVRQIRPIFDSYKMLQNFPGRRTPIFMAWEDEIAKFYFLYRCVRKYIMDGGAARPLDSRQLMEVRDLIFRFVNFLIRYLSLMQSDWYGLSGNLSGIDESMNLALLKRVPSQISVEQNAFTSARLMRAYNLLGNVRALTPPFTDDIKVDMLTWITLLVHSEYESSIRGNNIYTAALRNQINSGLFQLFIGGRRDELPPEQVLLLINFATMNQIVDEILEDPTL